MANEGYKDCSACGGVQVSPSCMAFHLLCSLLWSLSCLNTTLGSRDCPYYCLSTGRCPAHHRKNYASPACRPLAQLGGLVLLLEVTFYFLNLNTESFTPTWGSDLRHGMHYGHINIWMVLAPSLAVVWSRYSFHQLRYGLPRQRPTRRHNIILWRNRARART